MEQYEIPAIEIIWLEPTDVVTSSPPDAQLPPAP